MDHASWITGATFFEIAVSMNMYQFGRLMFNLPSLRVNCYDGGHDEYNRIKT